MVKVLVWRSLTQVRPTYLWPSSITVVERLVRWDDTWKINKLILVLCGILHIIPESSSTLERKILLELQAGPLPTTDAKTTYLV